MHTIAVLPGDGIGPEVCREAVKVLRTVADLYGHTFEYAYGHCGGDGYDKHGSHFSDDTLQLVLASDAVLFGSVGGPVEEQNQPKWKDAEKNCILGMRKALNLAINVRPAKIYPFLSYLSPLKDSIINKGVDLVIIRELISGIYFGDHSTASDGFSATDVMKYTYDEIAVCMKHAMDLAMTRSKKCCVVDKANVLDCSRLWRKVANEIAKGYPEVELQFLYVDNAMVQLIANPSAFDVIVTGNMFGDILSDAASVLPGSLGLMPSVSMSPNPKLPALYEPIGGSAPDIAGKDQANPLAQILSAALLLRHSFHMEEEARMVETAIHQVLESGKRTYDLLSPSDKTKVQNGETVSVDVMGTSRLGDTIATCMTELYHHKGNMQPMSAKASSMKTPNTMESEEATITNV